MPEQDRRSAGAGDGRVSRHRQFKGAAGKLVTGFTAAFVLYCILYIAGVLANLGIHIYAGSHRSAMLTFVLVMTFLMFPATRDSRRDRLPWYDAVFIMLSLITGGYLVVNVLAIARIAMPANALQQVLALVMLLLALEAARRTVSWFFSLLGIIFILYPFYAQFLPGLLHGSSYSFQRVMTTVYLQTEIGMNGSLMQVTATIIIIFITFGAFLEISGAGQFFIDLALRLMGRYRGGPAKVAVLASGLFGTMSGNATANVATTGVLTIPLMKSVGYKPHFAAAVETVAATGGAIMPPVMAATAFVMADILGISYWEVCLAALIPAILYYLAVMVMVDFEAARNRLRGLSPQEIPSLKGTLRGGWFYLLPVVVLMFFLVGLHYEATTAGIYALATVVVVSVFGKKQHRMGPSRIVRALYRGGEGILEVGAATAVASLLVSSLEMTGLGVKLTSALVLVAEGNQLILLLMAAIAALVLGLPLGPLAVYLTLALVVGPALIKAGITPVAAHLFLIYLATAGLITPPVAIPAFVAATIASSDFMRTANTAMRLGILAFIVPFVFTYSPELLLIGAPGDVALAVVTAVVGVVLLGAGLQGYLFRGINVWGRFLMVAAGIAMIVPGWTMDVAGGAAGAAMVLWQLGTRRRKAGAADASQPGPGTAGGRETVRDPGD